MKPQMTPPKTANIVSMIVARPSALKPLITWVSEAMEAEMTPGEFSLSSKKPMCFWRMLE